MTPAVRRARLTPSRVAHLLPALVLAFALAACGDSEGTDEPAGETSSPDAASGDCSYPESGQASRDVGTPPEGAAYSGQVDVTIATGVGDLNATLDADRAPCTVNSFLFLADQGYFDDTACHRLTVDPASIKVLQCGDPQGNGTGGPGYTFADELTGDESYTEGTLAMANAGPDTNGSQFFLVYGDSTALDAQPNYTIFGELTPETVDTIAGVAEDGTRSGGPDDAPATEVVIEGVTQD